jgi:transmembrane sensor
MTQSNQTIDFEAARWAVRLHAGGLAVEEQAELDHWLEDDSRHRGALLRARATWLNLDRLGALAARRAQPTGRVVEPLRTTTRVAHQFTNRRGFIAASVVALVFGGAGVWWTRRHGQVYISEVGEIRSMTLADGSHMVLNTATEATVDFDRVRREIQLTLGEGLFEVAKDPARPFIVQTRFVSVRAVGTVFAVRTINHRVDVTVTEGVVEVVDTNGSGSGVTHLVAANEHATVTETGRIEIRSVSHAEAERRLAWREGMIEFDGESLTDAVDEINRHNHRHVVVGDPTLAARPIVGRFRANDPEGFAATVAIALGAQRSVEEDAIYLRRRSNP